MKISISVTQPGVIRYPLHCHSFWEIMYYLEGTGHLVTSDTEYSFRPGTILIVPPRTIHGSVSEKGFKNISIGGSFEHLLLFNAPYSLADNSEHEGKMLAQAILRNQYGNHEYLSSLCASYVQFLLQHIRFDNHTAQTIRRIVTQIGESYTDPELDVTALLHESGYSEDYIRSRFRQLTGKTPVEFLVQLRIEHAQNMLDIYGHELTIGQISEKCGFSDPVYFSKRFKSQIGISPAAYRQKQCH